jgi:hypothetical protein
VLVCREPHARVSDDGILIMLIDEFVHRLWGHRLQ